MKNIKFSKNSISVKDIENVKKVINRDDISAKK